MGTVQPLTQLTEDEIMMKESVAKLASQIIAPFVKKMDIQQSFEPDVVNALFSNGVRIIQSSHILFVFDKNSTKILQKFLESKTMFPFTANGP